MSQLLSKEQVELLLARNSCELKSLLMSLPSSEKGRVFEELLAELYRGNGWLPQLQGGRDDAGADILLYHPKTPSRISLIVQAKNHSLPLTFDQTRIELIKFEEKAQERYACQNFRLISASGFVKEAGKLGDFNMLLDGWDHVASLIESYDPKHTSVPQIELFAHNRLTYEEIIKLWKDGDHVAVVQATGTGKSFLIAKLLADFQDKRKIVLAPSKYILKQQQSKIPWLSQTTEYMTYSKIGRMSSEKITSMCFELIVLDEFHRCGAEVWGAGVQTLLDTCSRAKVLGTSATPIRFLDNERDMAEELFDGIVAVDLSLAEAIARRILPAPTYISALYTLDEEIDNLLADVSASRRSEEEKNGYREEIKKIRLDWESTSGVPDILRKHLPPGVNKLIVFCRNQQHLDEMEIEVQRWFLKAGTHSKRKTYRILSADPESDRNLEAFKNADSKGTVHLLFAIDMLNEGLHIPEVGAVILLRPTESPIIFYQQIGRCIEVGNDNKPVIFDLVNNFSNVRCNDFKYDLDVAAKEERNRRSNVGLDESIPYVDIHDFVIEVEKVFAAISENLKSWESFFSELRNYLNEYGDTNVPKGYINNKSLAGWVRTQRGNYFNGLLSEERKNKLDNIGFEWTPNDSIWERRFEELRNFIKINGHANVSEKHMVPHLYSWVLAQRLRISQGLLSEYRINKLNEINFIWKVYESYHNEMISKLIAYKEKHGNCLVPRKYTEDHKLGSWVNSLRIRC
jgi:superfamily II DNA or RNA helicase